MTSCLKYYQLFNLNFPILKEIFFLFSLKQIMIYNNLVDSLVTKTVKNLPATCRPRFDPWIRNIPWRREWSHTQVFLPGKPQEQRSPWGYKESDTAERLTCKPTYTSRMKTFIFFCPPVPSRIWILSSYYYFYDSIVVYLR